jgi:hypothetical protein
MRRVTVASMMLFALALCGCQRFALDRRMEQLCKKDGGVKVYETVTLPPADYERVFSYVITVKSGEGYYGPDYRYVSEPRALVGANADLGKGQGRLVRWHEAIYRRSDSKLLGESVLYIRTGGDGFTFGFTPSNDSCPRPRTSLATSIFLKGE